MGKKNKSAAFERLAGDDRLQDERSFYGRSSMDLTDQMSYETYRSTGDKAPLVEMSESAAEHAENNANLRTALKQYTRLMMWCLATATAILYGGYDSGVLSAVTALPAFARDFGDRSPGPPDPLNPEKDWIVPGKWLSFWEGIGPIGQIVGAAVGGWLIDKIGRKLSLLVGSIIGACGIFLFVIAERPADKESKRIMILVAKIVQGLGIGIIKIETFTYLSEVVPVSLKGAVFALVPIFTLLGQIIGSLVGFVVSHNDTKISYMIALGSQLAVALPSFLLAAFLPESPTYHLNNRNPQKALKSFQRLLGPKNDAHAAMLKLQRAIEEEKKMSAKARYIDTLKGTNIRRTLIIMFASTIEILWGLPLLGTVGLYLKVLGLPASKALLFQIAGGMVGLFANGGSAWTLSHIGRRKLTYSSFLITACLWTVMGFSGIKETKFTPYIAGGIMTGVVSVCGLGAWPASYAIQGETSTLRLRAKSQAIASLTNSLLNMGVSALLPQVFNKDRADMGAKTGFLFAASCVVGAALTFLFVPEMKGRSAHEIDVLFEKRVSALRSTKWQNTAQEPLRKV